MVRPRRHVHHVSGRRWHDTGHSTGAAGWEMVRQIRQRQPRHAKRHGKQTGYLGAEEPADEDRGFCG